MDILSVLERFNTHDKCIEFIKQKRFPKDPYCLHCGSLKVGIKYRGSFHDWNYYECYSNFSILSNTIFHKTLLPLPKWFLAIAIMTNAKKSISNCELAEQLGISQTAAWRIQMKIREAMGEGLGAVMFNRMGGNNVFLFIRRGLPGFL